MTLENLARARADRAADLKRVAAMNEDEVAYLTADGPDSETDDVEHDEDPKLTDEEWRFILDMQGNA